MYYGGRVIVVSFVQQNVRVLDISRNAMRCSEIIVGVESCIAIWNVVSTPPSQSTIFEHVAATDSSKLEVNLVTGRQCN